MTDLINRLSGQFYIPFCIGLFFLLIIFLFIFLFIDIKRWKQK